MTNGSTSFPTRLQILVVGDSYMPTGAFKSAFQNIESDHDIRYMQVDPDLVPTPESVQGLSEYEGSPEQLADHIRDIDVLVVHGAPVNDQVLRAAKNLKLVCCARGGPVNVDQEALMKRGIRLATTPGKNAEAVADLTIALMIVLARRLRPAFSAVASGRPLGRTVFEGSEFFGDELGNTTLGLVGFGRVGSRVANRALGFGMQISVYDPFVELENRNDLDQVSDLGLLLETSDYVSLHARASVDNVHMISEPEFIRMKRSAFLINTARESLVDEEALDQALLAGQIAGAALDTVEANHKAGVHPLLAHPNVVITPHVGGATFQTLARGAAMLRDEIEVFLFELAQSRDGEPSSP